MKINRLNKYLKNSWQILVLVLVAVVLAVTLRIFVFSTFKIPSPSMEPALKSGDYIIVNKLIPGARIFKDYDFLENNSKPNLWRLKGVRSIKRNDVLVFNFPYSTKGKLSLDINKYYVKRCIAIPGDTFYIDNGIYKVKGCKDTLGNIENQMRMSHSLESDFESNVFQCFPKRSSYHWNLKFFGPLYVPHKGDCLNIDTMNISLYRQLIEYETARYIKQKGGQVLLNDSCISKYTFQTNYYFMSGDHVLDSRDSRYWGLLPEDHIVGKASIIWKSEDKYSGEIRWNRVMKFIK
ncbi:MAG: signal peptidase I [Paludibacter sp.]|nr:signal peptidase I [Paludibacter sp.]